MLVVARIRAEAATEAASRLLQEIGDLRKEQYALKDQRWRLEDEYGHRQKAGVDVSDIQAMLMAIHEALAANRVSLDAAELEARKYGIDDSCCGYY